MPPGQRPALESDSSFRISHFAFRISPHAEDAARPAFSREDILTARFRLARVMPYQRSAKPFIGNLSLSILSGLLLVFSFPEWNFWSLGWVGVAPLIMAVARERRFWRSLFYGTMTGTILFAGSSSWVTYSMHSYGGLPLWLSYILLVILAALLGVFTGLFGAVLALAVKQFGGWAILLAPAVWVASEFARIEVTGTGWNALGYSQAFQPLVIQIARWGGVYAVSAILVAASTALVFAMIYLERLRGFLVLSAAGVLTILVIFDGYGAMPQRPPSKSVPVIAIQSNVPINGEWGDPSFEEQLLATLISMSEQAITAENNGLEGMKGKGPSLVIWPESPMNFRYERDAALRARLAEFTRRNQVYLLINSWAYLSENDTSETVFNSAMVIGPSGERISRYDKIALVPFGEYVPARGWIPFMDRIPALVADVTAGRGDTTVMAAGETTLGTMICFEATRPDIARRMRRQGASALVQLSNEAWFGPTAAPRQFLAHSVFRAVENNIELIRATNSGLSAEISANGYVDGETPTFDRATRRWRVRTAEEAAVSDLTYYTRHGDVFACTCAGISALLGVGAGLSMKWKGRDSEDD